MNELQIFKRDEYCKLKEMENKNIYMGFFYVLEYGDLVKIGSTKKPYERVMALKRNAEKYGNSRIGRIALSVPHTNFTENERKLHSFFSAIRKNGSELFESNLDEIVSKIPKTIEYKDETEQKEKRAEDFINGIKNFILGGKML